MCSTTLIADIMKIPSVLPVSALQSRAARFQLGMTQAEVIKQSELPGWKLKQFETDRFVPDIPFLTALRSFYVERGIELPAVEDQPSAKMPSASKAPSQKEDEASFPGLVPFFMMSDLTEAQVEAVMHRVMDNDERINGLLAFPVRAGFFGGWDDETKEKSRELFGALAENYLLLARLQGRVLLGKETPEPTNHAELLAQSFAGSLLGQLTSKNATPQADPESNDETGVEEEEEQA